MTKPNTGTRYEIAIDGTPRTYRDTEKIALEAGTRLKTKQPHSEVTVAIWRPARSLRSSIRSNPDNRLSHY